MGYFHRSAALACAALSLLLPSLNLAQAQIQNIVVTSGASFQPGLPPGGSIGTIFCTGLTVSGVVSAEATPLPYTLSGITVTIGGVPAPLFAVAQLAGYQQINFQVPYDFQAGDGPGGLYAEVLIQQNATQGSINATVGTPPGDFFLLSGTQYGIFQHWPDYSLVTKDNPAKPGEWLVTYLTGVGGILDFSVPIGQPAPLSPVDRVVQSAVLGDTFNMVVNGSPVGNVGDPNAIPFLGLAPGLVGVYQINFVLPVGTAPGDAQVKLRFTTHGIDLNGPAFSYDSAPVLLPVQ
jgi:uncharacterized protein (TIGR03437 family)